MTNGRGWMIFRGLLFLSGLGLMGYVAYRYTLFSPPDHGSLYGKIFPLALVLAALGMTLAAWPYLFAKLNGHAGLAVRGALTAFGGVWMATGVMCARSLARGMVDAPLGGTWDMVHMLSDHVFLPLAVIALAWVPVQVGRWMGAREAEPSPTAEPALSAGC